MVSDFNKKRKDGFWNKKVLFQLLSVLFVIIIFGLLFVNFRMHERKRDLILQLEFYEKQIEQIKKSNQELEEGIANSEDLEYLERIAYEQLGQQKPGEKAVIFVAPEQEPAESLPTQDIWTGWFSGIWNWIKSKF